MASQLELLTPGITQMFSAIGYKVYVTDTGKCKITLVNSSGGTQSQEFPWPVTNRDLSTQLKAWRDELKGTAA